MRHSRTNAASLIVMVASFVRCPGIMVVSRASAMNRVAAEPVVEADGAEAGAIAGRQRSVVQLGSEVAPVHVSDHLALVAARGQELSRELVHRAGLRARN